MIRENRLDELEQFKSSINLTEYMASVGYELDKSRGASSRNSAVMRDSGGDKLIVAKGQDNHWVYFSVKDQADNGSIIDFVQKRKGANLGQVRKALRPWLGRPAEPVEGRKFVADLQPSDPQRQRVMHAYAQAQPTQAHRYLMGRGITSAIQHDPRFAGTVRIDPKGNAVFPHYDSAGLSGYELKNKDFTGFSRGGSKGLWFSTNVTRADRVVVVESAIDALSHAALSADKGAAYLSTGGSLGARQRALLSTALGRAAAQGSSIVIATDADQGGDQLAKEIGGLVPAGAKVQRERPTTGKDWNDQLRMGPSRSRSSGGHSMGM